MSRPRGAGRCLDISPAPTVAFRVNKRNLFISGKRAVRTCVPGFRPFVAMAQLGEPHGTSDPTSDARCAEAKHHCVAVFFGGNAKAIRSAQNSCNRLATQASAILSH